MRTLRRASRAVSALFQIAATCCALGAVCFYEWGTE